MRLRQWPLTLKRRTPWSSTLKRLTRNDDTRPHLYCHRFLSIVATTVFLHHRLYNLPPSLMLRPRLLRHRQAHHQFAHTLHHHYHPNHQSRHSRVHASDTWCLHRIFRQ
jgi:hypothetical protein